MNILIADDTEDLRISLKKTLESAGYYVRDASNGAEALQMAKESPPDMIISDILMPEMDGYQFCRKVKENVKLRKIPFIFYTATYSDPEDEKLAMSLGASRFILKPMGVKDFLGILEEVIREYKEDTLHIPRMPIEEDAELHRMHDESLSRMLDKKIRALKKERNALMESENKFRDLTEKSLVGVYLIQDGIFIYCNPRLAEIFGYTVEELSNRKGPEDLVYPEDWETVRENLRKRIAGEIDSIHYGFRGITKQKKTIYVDVYGSATEYHGSPAVIGTLLDATDRRKTEQERERLNLELSQRNKELKNILYVTSHDLRSPLVNVQGYSSEMAYSLKELQALLQGIDVPSDINRKIDTIIDEDIPEAMNYINSSVKKMYTLLSGLLSISRLGRFELTMEDIDMNSLMPGVINTLEFQIKEAGVQVKISDLPACRADSSMVNQMFTNLLDNALKYLSLDRDGLIRISGKREEGQSVYCVEDNGIGIAPEYHEKIFELFHQLDPANSSGEGMGLSIVRLGAEKHHGSVRVESQPGKGSKFYVSLPVTTV